MQDQEDYDDEYESIEETTIKSTPWPTLPPPPITTAIPEVSFDIDSPSDSASLLFLTNPDLLPDVDLDQDLDEETPILEEDEALKDNKFIVENRNRVLQVCIHKYLCSLTRFKWKLHISKV